MKVTIFLEEVFSVIFTPFILWWSLPKCSDRIIDFFREFTVHVDGIGYVCSFAEFKLGIEGVCPSLPKFTGINTDINKQQLNAANADTLRNDYFSTKDNKMMASYMGFIQQYHAPGKGVKRTQPTHPSMLPLSPTQTIDGRWRAPQDQRLHNPSQSLYRDSQGRTTASMMRSSLLDHHHQPRNTRLFQPSLREEDEDSESGTPRYRSNLGESFVSNGIGEGVDEERPSSAAGAGVLDLLNQFVGATEGAKRPGGAVV